MFLKTQ